MSSWPLASFSCAAEFDCYRCIADSAKPSARQIYGFTASADATHHLPRASWPLLVAALSNENVGFFSCRCKRSLATLIVLRCCIASIRRPRLCYLARTIAYSKS